MVIELFVAGAAICAAVRAYKAKQGASQALVRRDQAPALSWFERTKRTLARFVPQPNVSTFDQARGEQWRRRGAQAGESATSRQEREIDRQIKLSLGLFGVTVVGGLGVPVLTVISLPFLIYQVMPHFRAGHDELVKERKVGDAVLRALSRGVVLALHYFPVAALGGVLFWVEEKLLLKARNTSRRGLTLVLGELPRNVWVERREVAVETPLEDVKVGDTVVIHAGEAIAVDGTITHGVASIDQRMLTGEAQPAEKGVGESVFAATVVLSGIVRVRVERAGADTVVARIEEILHRTADYTSSLELKGKVIAERTVLPTLAASAVTLPLLGPVAAACVLGCYPEEGMRILAPLSLLNYLKSAAEDAILIKDGRALESLQDVDTVVFDKTGTLTRDEPHVAAVHPYGDHNEEEVLRLAAAAETKQSHPVARALLAEAEARHLALPVIDEASTEVGYGVKVGINGRHVRVGSRRYMDREGVAVPPQLEEIEAHCHAQGYTLVYVALGEAVGGAIELHPTLRPEVEDVVETLRRRGLELYIVSGDHEEPTRQLARQLGIERYFHETLPEQKADLIEHLQGEGRSVCFVGDGINDAIALKKAHVSVSLRGASTIASDTAQIVFLDGKLDQLPRLFELADRVALNMRNNLTLLIAPSPILLGGIYFLNFRVLATAVLSFASAVGGLANAMLPAWRSTERSKKDQEESQGDAEDRAARPAAPAPGLDAPGGEAAMADGGAAPSPQNSSIDRAAPGLEPLDPPWESGELVPPQVELPEARQVSEARREGEEPVPTQVQMAQGPQVEH